MKRPIALASLLVSLCWPGQAAYGGYGIIVDMIRDTTPVRAFIEDLKDGNCDPRNPCHPDDTPGQGPEPDSDSEEDGQEKAHLDPSQDWPWVLIGWLEAV